MTSAKSPSFYLAVTKHHKNKGFIHKLFSTDGELAVEFDWAATPSFHHQEALARSGLRSNVLRYCAINGITLSVSGYLSTRQDGAYSVHIVYAVDLSTLRCFSANELEQLCEELEVEYSE